MFISKILLFITRVVQILLALYLVRLVIKLFGFNVYIPILDDIFLMIWKAFIYVTGLIEGIVKLPRID
jgi:hypothetical protein